MASLEVLTIDRHADPSFLTDPFLTGYGQSRVFTKPSSG